MEKSLQLQNNCGKFSDSSLKLSFFEDNPFAVLIPLAQWEELYSCILVKNLKFSPRTSVKFDVLSFKINNIKKNPNEVLTPLAPRGSHQGDYHLKIRQFACMQIFKALGSKLSVFFGVSESVRYIRVSGGCLLWRPSKNINLYWI